MQQKILFIFGAEGGLGRGITASLLKYQYDLIYLFDFGFKNQYPDKRVKARTISDLSERDNAKGLFDDIPFDISKSLYLVSTIGGYTGGISLEENSQNDVKKMLDMNFKSAVNLMQEFIKSARRCKFSSVILTSAMTSLKGTAGAALYGASKAALNYIVETLAEEGREYNMSINAIAPFILDTPAKREWVPREKVPTLIKPEETGDFIHSLFESSHFISGNIIKLNHRFPVTD